MSLLVKKVQQNKKLLLEKNIMVIIETQILKLALNTLNQGGLIAYPTEGVYGLGCDPFNRVAVKTLSQLKQRSYEKPFILVASNVNQIMNLIETNNIPNQQRIFDSWPSATTWVFPLSTVGKQTLHTDQSSIAIRVSKHPIIQTLCTHWQKPLVSTSANLSNQPPIKTYDEMISQFHNKLDLIIPGNIGELSGPTPIIDACTGHVLRDGVNSNDP